MTSLARLQVSVLCGSQLDVSSVQDGKNQNHAEDAAEFVIDRSGATSLYAAFAECCPPAVRNSDPFFGRQGLSEVEFNKVLERNGFLKARRRIAGAKQTAGAQAVYYFANRRWRNPDEPGDMADLKRHWEQLVASSVVFAGQCPWEKFCATVGKHYQSWVQAPTRTCKKRRRQRWSMLDVCDGNDGHQAKHMRSQASASRSEDVASRPEIKSSNSVAPSIDAIMINNVDDAVSVPGSHQKEPRPAVQLQADATPAPTHAVDHQTTLQSRQTLLEKSESRNLDLVATNPNPLAPPQSTADFSARTWRRRTSLEQSLVDGEKELQALRALHSRYT